MSIKNLIVRVGEYLKLLTIQAMGALIGALLVGLFAGYSLRKEIREGPPQPIEVVTRSDLRRAIEKAQSRLIAAGYVLKDIDANLISGKPPSFETTLVWVDPLGDGKSNSIICQRQRDEARPGSGFDDYEEILKKIKQFHPPSESGSLIGRRLTLGVIDLYPTMAVLMVDEDLYAYSYPYGEASNSPVIKFANFWNAKEKDKDGKFFDDHLNKMTSYRDKVESSRTKFLSTASDFAKYYKAGPNPCR